MEYLETYNPKQGIKKAAYNRYLPILLTHHVNLM